MNGQLTQLRQPLDTKISPLHILLIEEPERAEQILPHLHLPNYSLHVKLAKNAEELQALLQAQTWNLIIGNPHQSHGLLDTALSLIAESQTRIPVIAVSDNLSEPQLAQLLRQGVRHHLKTDDINLLPALARHLIQESSERQGYARNMDFYLWQMRFHQLADNSPLGSMLIQNQRIIYLNFAARKLLGLDLGVANPGIPLNQILLHPKLPLSEQTAIDARGQLDQPVTAEFRSANGETFSADVWYSKAAAPESQTLQLFFREHHQTNRLSAGPDYASRVFEHSREGILILDEQYRILTANPAFSEITGFSKGEILGKEPGFLQSTPHIGANFTEIWQYLKLMPSWRGEIVGRGKSGESFSRWLSIDVIANLADRSRLYIALFSDIAAIKESQQKLHYIAHHDPLTGLPNRLLFESRLEHAIHQAKRQNSYLAVLFLDLDRFKNINDSLGHAVGDALLKQVATRLTEVLREQDTAARLGGDEFTIMIEDLQDPNHAGVIAEKILHQFAESFRVKGHNLNITPSIGISLYPSDGTTVGHLTKNADAAMYQAKESGRNNFRFYVSKLTHDAYERLLIESELRTAIAENQLLLYYQPQIAIDSNRLVGAEALLRWNHPRKGVISPGSFIPMAEETGLIHDIGDWVLENVCKHTRSWTDAGIFQGQMALNISAQQLIHTDLILRFENIIERTGCPPERLQFEVTEGLFLSHKDRSIPVLDVFKKLGITLAIDDFGTGFSSLSYLKHLPIDKLKIDRSFVKDMPVDSDAVAIAQAVISLGRALGLDIIAEGTETKAQLHLLKDLGCNEAQGFFFDPPMPAEVFERQLMEKYAVKQRRKKS